MSPCMIMFLISISKDKLISTSIKKKMTDKEGKNLKKFRWLIDMTFVSHSIIGEISTILTIEHVRNKVLLGPT